MVEVAGLWFRFMSESFRLWFRDRKSKAYGRLVVTCLRVCIRSGNLQGPDSEV